jgi:rubredoxin
MMMTKKDLTKSLLKGHICNNCHHCFDREKGDNRFDSNQVCWMTIERMVNLPKEHTCENFRIRVKYDKERIK